jgi:DNA-binding transcriptional LysR family regulator
MITMHQVDTLAVDPGLLPTLDVLLRERNVSRAAERLGRTQPAISHALARLREQLGDPLLVRVGQRFVLTPRAEALREPLHALLGELAALVRPSPVFDPATSARVFRMISTDYIAALVLPPLVERVRTAAPNVDLHVRPGSRTFHAELGEGGADLGFVVRTPTEAGIRARKLFRDRFVCVLRRDHPAGPRLDLAEFLRLPHALVAPLGNPGGYVDDALAELGHGARRIAVTVPHFLLAPALVAASDLIITLPERVAQIVCATHPLRIVPLPLRLPVFEVALVWHDRVHRDPANVWLRAEVLASMRG